MGNPSKIIKQVDDEMLAWKTEGTRLYQQLPELCRNSLKPCEPLTENKEQEHLFKSDYQPFKK